MTGGFFLILDDISMLLKQSATMADDIAIAAKRSVATMGDDITNATTKTGGVLIDDFAVTADKTSAFGQERELKVIWAITKGSFINKMIILPLIFLLKIFAFFMIIPILLLGGMYLSYEGFEKLVHYFSKEEINHHEEKLKNSTKEDILKIEKKKIKSAIITDFILSIEIVVIALSTVLDKPLSNQIITVSFVAILATIIVYGIVALIVRIDNVGFWLIKKGKDNNNIFLINTGQYLVNLLPKIIKMLGYIGTIAMFLVGGGLFTHNIEILHHFVEHLPIHNLIIDFVLGIIIGTIIYYSIEFIKSIKNKIIFN